MGGFPNRLTAALPLWTLVVLITALNVFLLARVFGIHASSGR